MRRVTTTALLAVVAGFMLNACDQQPKPVTLHADILLSEPYGQDIIGEQTEMAGKLDVSDAGCVSLSTDDGEYPVWAVKGSTLEKDGTAVKLADLGEFALGDTVKVPGRVETIASPQAELRPKGFQRCFSKADRTQRQITAAFIERPIEGPQG